MDGGLNRLLSYVERTKDATEPEIVSIIQEVLAHQDIFVFAELLNTPKVASLEDKEKKLINTLRLFSTGTYIQYTQKVDDYIPLTEQMKTKLRLLSLLTLCASLTV